MWRNNKGQSSAVRETFSNGDPCGYHNGCGQCEPLMINGVFCHEQGCPNAWRDTEIPCFICGFAFYPKDRPVGFPQTKICPSCIEGLQGDQDNERTL